MVFLQKCTDRKSVTMSSSIGTCTPCTKPSFPFLRCWPITSVGGRLEGPRGPATPATVNHQLPFPIHPGLGDICHMRRIDFWSATLNYWFPTVVAQNVIFSKVSRIYAGQQFAVPPQSIIQRSPCFLCDAGRELFICWRSVDINLANMGGKDAKKSSVALYGFFPGIKR